jgi:Protein of unknown function (DUF5818)
MNHTNTFLNLAMMTVVFAAVVPSVGLDSIQAGDAHTQQFAMQGQSGDKTEVKIFTGTIWMSGDRFVLRDEHQKHWYQLDVDQKFVAKFEGKQVKVIGTLDAANSEIRVQRIEEG